jgi:hypothetical protein
MGGDDCEVARQNMVLLNADPDFAAKHDAASAVCLQKKRTPQNNPLRVTPRHPSHRI